MRSLVTGSLGDLRIGANRADMGEGVRTARADADGVRAGPRHRHAGFDGGDPTGDVFVGEEPQDINTRKSGTGNRRHSTC